MARWGLMGAGAVSSHFAASLQLVPNATIQAVTSRSVERASSFASSYGAARFYTGYSEMLADPNVDIVYVATPTAFHAAHAVEALEAGKSVLVEKPFAATKDQAKQIVDAARAAGRFCMEGMWMRFVPTVQDIRRRVLEGEIGTPRLLQADIGFHIPFDANSRYYSREAGGGVILDLGIYGLSLAQYLLGWPDALDAQIYEAPNGVDEQASIVLMCGETMVQITCSFAGRLTNTARLVGSAATIDIHEPFFAPRGYSLERTTGGKTAPDKTNTVQRGIFDRYPSLATWRHRVRPLVQLLQGRRRNVTHSFKGYGYQFEAMEAQRCLTAGQLESETMPLNDSVRLIELADLALHEQSRQRIAG
jgi:predicted dehydrogenase